MIQKIKENLRQRPWRKQWDRSVEEVAGYRIPLKSGDKEGRVV